MPKFNPYIQYVTMKSISLPKLFFLACLFGIFGFQFMNAQTMTAAQAAEAPGEQAKIEWLTFEEAMKKMDKEPRKVMIDVYTDWCGWCKRMDATTFHHPEIVQYVNENYYAVKLDAEQKADINFAGRAYKFVANGRRGYHELAAELMAGRMSYPTVVYLDESKKVLQAIPGFKAAKDQDKILKYWGDNAYRDVKWEVFDSAYESPIVP